MLWYLKSMKLKQLCLLFGHIFFLFPSHGRAETYQESINFVSLMHCNTYCNGAKKVRIRNQSVSQYPLCRTCVCDDLCAEYGDCCPDVNGKIRTNLQHDFKCVALNPLKCWNWYYMITSCPGEIVAEANDIRADGIAPVTSLVTNATYLNSTVAECNNENAYWSWGAPICQLKRDRSVDIPPPANRSSTNVRVPRSCDPKFSGLELIDFCTTNSSTLDKDLERLCENETHFPVSFNSKVFKNIFCCQCNGASLQPTLTIPRTPNISASINDLWCTFCLLKEPLCSYGQWYDKVKRTCHDLKCRSPLKLNGGNCELNITGQQSIGYELLADLSLSKADLSLPYLQHWPSLLQLPLNAIPPIINGIGELDTFLLIQQIEATDTAASSDFVPVLRVRILVKIKGKQWSKLEDEKMSILSREFWKMTYKDDDHTVRMTTNLNSPYRVAQSELFMNNAPSTIQDYLDFRKNVEFVNLPRELPQCPVVLLNREDVTEISDGFIQLYNTELELEDNQYKYINNKMAVCVDVMDEVLKDYVTQMPENIVSVFFCTLSLVCLALTLLTYFMFPSLLTLPTKNTMCLTLCLFLAQLMFQFMDFIKDTGPLCSTYGVIIHYLWLSVFFWMNVCSFHMFRVFVIDAAKPLHTENSWKHLVKYIVYANGLPLVIIIFIVSINLKLTSGTDIGYGWERCYISSSLGYYYTSLYVGVGFLLPLGIILLLNIIFFISTVYKMSKIRQQSGAVHHDNSQVQIYIKLSSLTGLFWTLAILSDVFQVKALVFIAIVLNGSQGVFIFLSYIANKRILVLWRSRFQEIGFAVRRTPLSKQ